MGKRYTNCNGRVKTVHLRKRSGKGYKDFHVSSAVDSGGVGVAVELEIKRWAAKAGFKTIKAFALAAGTQPITFHRIRHGERIAQETADKIRSALGATVGQEWWNEVGRYIVTLPARRTPVLGSVSSADGAIATMRDATAEEVPIPGVSDEAFAVRFETDELLAAGIPAGAQVVFEPATDAPIGRRVMAEFHAPGKPPLRMVRRLAGTPERRVLESLVPGQAPEINMGPGWCIVGICVGVFLPEA